MSLMLSPTIAKQLPTIAQTVAYHCPNSCLPLPKQLPTIAQILAHVSPPWDAMLTGSPSRILETLCEAFHSVAKSQLPTYHLISSVLFMPSQSA